MHRRLIGWMGIAAIVLSLSLLLSDGSNQGMVVFAKTTQIAQAPANDVPVLAQPGLAIIDSYEDPQGSFEIGILEGYSESFVAGSPLFQIADGSLAYSVIKVPLTSDVPLSDIGLVDVAQRSLSNGEGFQTQTFNTVPGGGLQIAWSGRLSQGTAAPQPVQGTILAKQQGAEAYLMVVAALEEAVPQLPQVISILANTLKIL